MFYEENEEYALMRCRDVWVDRYPDEPFESEVDSCSEDQIAVNEGLFNEVKRNRFRYSKFSEPYLGEMLYLIAARQRYRGFLSLWQRFKDSCSRLVPTVDILLMLLTHQTTKPYTITKQWEQSIEEEHNRFLEALKLYGQDWRHIEEYIGTKTAVQIRSSFQSCISEEEAIGT